MKKPAKKKSRKSRQSTAEKKTRNLFLYGLLGVLVLTFIALNPFGEKTFLKYDDDWYITENPYVQNFSADQLSHIFGSTYYGQYSPVPMLVEGVKVSIFGNNASVFYIFGILIHLLNVSLVFFFLFKLCKRYEPALIVAALFALSPLQVESLAWLSSPMKIGLYTTFFLLGLMQYLKYVEEKKISHYIWTLAFFLLAFFSKEQAVAFSINLIAIDWFKDRKLLSKTVLLEKVPFLFLSLIFGLITLSISQGGSEVVVHSFSLVERVVFASFAVIQYVIKLIIPFELSAFYPYPLTAAGSLPGIYYIYPLLLAGLIGLFVFSLRRSRILAFGLMFFAINISLSLLTQVISVREIVMADRYLYFASIGIFFIVGMGYLYLAEKYPSLQKGLIAGLGIYLLLMAFLTFNQVKVWRNDFALWDDTVKKYPNSGYALNNLGLAYKRDGKINEAMAHFKLSIERDPAYPLAYSNRGNLYYNSNQNELAMADYVKTLSLKPDDSYTLSSRGALYAKTGDLENALKDLSKAIELNPLLMDAYSNRALVYASLNQYENAVRDFSTYLKYRPGADGVLNTRGVYYQRLGRQLEAMQDFNRSIALNPKVGVYYLNRAYSQLASGNKASARQDAQRAQQLGVQIPGELLQQIQ